MELRGLPTAFCYWQACVRHTDGTAEGSGTEPSTTAIEGMMGAERAGTGEWVRLQPHGHCWGLTRHLP